MSNDLISRRAVIEEMNNLLKSPYANNIQFGAERREVIENVKKLCVEKIPTAYDVDKVVEQLKNARDKECVSSVPKIRMCDAIEIVKAGGVNEAPESEG